MLYDGRPYEKAFRAERLGIVRCMRAVEHLINALGDESKAGRNMVLYSLGRMGDAAGVACW